MTTTQLRVNLDTLLRHGVLAEPEMVADVAARLSDRENIRRARMMPYQLLAAVRHVDKRVPRQIVDAIEQALEYSVSNVPELGGRVVLCPDVSGSMPAAILRRNPGATVAPFSDDVVHLERPLDPLDSIVKNADRLASLPSGGTACSAPLRWLNARGEAPDVVVFVSDNQSWSDFRLSARHDPNGPRGTVMAEEWQRLRGRTPKAKLILINVGGFSDAVFDVISAFTRGDLAGDSWLREIESIALD
jgi:60 kDa SS-A/Ro ribonucleoprotein